MSDIVLAATFPNDRIASIARGMLEANGIPSILENQYMSGIYPISFNSLGEVRLMVNASQLEDALRLLNEHGDIND